MNSRWLAWHRLAGISAAVFVVFLSVTGLLLMHSDRLELPNRQVNAGWLLNWYGIRPAPPPLSFRAGANAVSQIGTQLYVNDTELMQTAGILLGAEPLLLQEPLGALLAVVTSDGLMIYDAQGQLVERIGHAGGLPQGLTRAGRDLQGGLVLGTDTQHWRYAVESGDFTVADSSIPIRWSAPAALDAELERQLADRFRGTGLTIERVLLDLHAGRLLGKTGVVLVNLASLLLVFLALSGMKVWWSRLRSQRARRNQRRP